MAMNDTLLIGIGNTLRGDDGAGVYASEQCAARYPLIDCMSVHQLHPEIAETVCRYSRVIFIDASVTADDVSVSIVVPNSEATRGETHSYSPATLLSLCSSLYEMTPERAVLIEIPAERFEFGETLSARTTEMITRAVDLVHEETAIIA